MARIAAVRTPITDTLHGHPRRPPRRGIQPSGLNLPAPAWVQTPTQRDVWHTTAARVHPTTPPAATVTLRRKRV
jgi:hypothetical protein